MDKVIKLLKESGYKVSWKEQTKERFLKSFIEENQDKITPSDLDSLEYLEFAELDILVNPPIFNISNLRELHEIKLPIIVTSAQNNTAVHATAFRKLVALAEEKESTLVVLPVRYNKSAFSQAVESEQENWYTELQPFLIKEPFQAGEAVCYASTFILPTTKMPVNAGQDLNAGELYSILASPKIQQKELPRTVGQSRRTVFTTGSITLPNYLNSRAGSVAETEHRISALLITEGQEPEVLEYNNTLGWSYDFQTIVLGDIHSEALDSVAFNQSLKQFTTFGIKNVVLHDLLDFQNRNGHNRNSGKHLFQERNRTIKDDLLKVCSVLADIASNLPDNGKIYVVRSNHDDMLDRWLDDLSYKPQFDPQNAKLYYMLQYLQLEDIENGHYPIMLETAIDFLAEIGDIDSGFLEKIEFLTLNSALTLHGVECSQHGHKGTNGARSGLQRTNLKMVTGHSHTGGRMGNHVVVGTIAKLQQGYNAGGGTTWTQHNALICKTGRVKLITT